MKRLGLVLLCLTLALVLSGKAAQAVPYCDCEICAADGDQTCRDPFTSLLRPCVTFYGIYCNG